jgi:hypothetical protein
MDKFYIMKTILEVADSLPFNSPERTKLRMLLSELTFTNRIDVVFHPKAYMSENLREKTLVQTTTGGSFSKLVKNEEAA